jgi:glycosyltransferase involved in cell wall biosynthesis
MPERRPLRILHVAASTMGGVGLLLHYKMRDMDPARFHQTLVCGAGAPLDERFVADGLDIRFADFSRSAFTPRNLFGFRYLLQLMKRERFDVVHTHTSVGGLYGRLAGTLRGVGTRLWTVHGYSSHPGQPWGLRGLLRGVERSLDRITDHYVAISRAMRDQGVAAGIFEPAKVSVIANGLDLEPYPFVPARDDAQRSGNAMISAIARFEPQKGVEYLIRAMPEVLRQCPGVRLRVAGDGPQRAFLEELTRKLGLGETVVFLGWRSDVQQVLAESDLCCMPSVWEGFGLVLVEAMAVGRPVVASAVDGIPEVVQDGVTGCLVPPRDPGALAQALVALIKDPGRLRVMGKASRQRAERHFDHRRMLDNYAALYERLTHGTPPGNGNGVT